MRYENNAPKLAPIREKPSHQPKTIANAVPRFTLLTQVNPGACSS